MAEDLEITKSEKIKILLTEYKVAQQYTDASADRIWKLTGFLFVNALGSIFVMTQIRGSWVVFSIALGSIGLIIFWVIAFVRESFYERATDRRMQYIEKLLQSYSGMQDLDKMLHTWVRYWAEFNRDKRTPADPEASDHNYIWPSWSRCLGRRPTWPTALVIAAISAVVILIVAFSLAWS